MKHIGKAMAVVFALVICLGMLPGAATAEGAESAKTEKTISAAGTAEIKEKTTLSASSTRGAMLTFSSDAPFTIRTKNGAKNWNGTLYYSTNAQNWTVWNGAATLASGAHDGEQRLYLRGRGNTVITGQPDNSAGHGWTLTGGEVACSGNIESLLNYQTAASGAHPAMADYCFAELFAEWESLVSAPELPAKTLSKYCYASMFCGCYALSAAPALPAKKLAAGCYSSMFSRCSSLQAAPKLPATMLEEDCYNAMFYSSGLVTLPALPAVELPQGCYYMMFVECTGIRLSEVPTEEYSFPYRIPSVEPSQHVGTNALEYMFSHTGGPFADTPEVDRVYYLPAPAELPDDQVLTFGAEQPFTLKTVNGAKNWDGTLFYSTDKMLWTEWDGAELTSCLQDGREKLYLCGVENTVIAGNENGWTLTGIDGEPVPQPDVPPQRWLVDGPNITCSGNIETILDFLTVSAGAHPRMENGCFSHLFYECENLVSAPKLPATELTPSCYKEMFSGTGLTFAPALPATELALECYSGMFRNCTTLRAAPVLQATTLAEGCYYTMFAGCTSLKNAPVLPATVLADECYYGMFEGCTLLTTAPELSSTAIAGGCYSLMFKDCTSLTAAPVLPAMTLAENCYHSMFRGCTALRTAPVLPATTLAAGCYSSMFRGCTALRFVPALRVTELAPFCYALMFMDCTALQAPAALPATDLPEHCYWKMFDGCTGIKLSEVPTPEYNMPYRIPIIENAQFVGADALLDMFSRTGGPFADTPEADRIYYLPAPGEGGELTFSSAEPFTLATSNGARNWNGALYYSTDLEHWAMWDGAATLESGMHDGQQKLYLCGFGNSRITGYSDSRWVLTGSAIACTGNIENLLNYVMVSNGAHPAMAERCYYGMFDQCEALTMAPMLPATWLTRECYGYMFFECTSLEKAPVLPARTLAPGCYKQMFSMCAALRSVPELPATTLADSCYMGMFESCAVLAFAPELPATRLADFCYADMFGDCPALQTAPELPATELAKGCYRKMFWGCTSLTTPAQLPATNLRDECYNGMYDGCTGIRVSEVLTFEYNVPYRIPSVGQSQYVGTNALLNMFRGTGGPFAATPLADRTYYLPGDLPIDGMLMFRSNTPFTLQLSTIVPPWNGTVEYSTDTVHWSLWGGETIASVLHNGRQSLYLRGSGNTRISRGNGANSPYSRFILDGSEIDCIGNIENLLDYQTVFSGAHPTMEDDCFAYLFRYCTALRIAPSLPAEVLSDRCYKFMFEGCTSLWAAPALPASAVCNQSYYGMFWGCTSLAAAPALPAMTLAPYCYEYMFEGCTSLEAAPELPAIELAEGCYAQMFSSCSSLTTVPEVLPAVVLAEGCYGGMFQYCESLETAPELPAMVLKERCYVSMFAGCTSLVTPPALRAMDIAPYCYDGMFLDCTSLTALPALPAVVLYEKCYFKMFLGCAGIKISTRQTDEYTIPYTIPDSGYVEFVGDDSMYYMFGLTGGVFSPVTPEATVVYYLHNSNSIVW